MKKETNTMVLMINNEKLEYKTIDGNPVVTFKDIDRVHDRKEGITKRNFINNKKYFIDGVDYYKLTPSSIPLGKIYPAECIKPNNNGTYYFTQSGYLMLTKSLTDDLSWQVHRKLVDTYFAIKTGTPSTEEIAQSLRPIVAQEINNRMRITDNKMQEINNRIGKMESSASSRSTVQRFTVWKKDIGKEIQRLSSISDYTTGQIYSNIYTRMNDLYDIDLSLIQEEYYAEHPHVSHISTINLVDIDEERRNIFEKLLTELADKIAADDICSTALQPAN